MALNSEATSGSRIPLCVREARAVATSLRHALVQELLMAHAKKDGFLTSPRLSVSHVLGGERPPMNREVKKTIIMGV